MPKFLSEEISSAVLKLAFAIVTALLLWIGATSQVTSNTVSAIDAHMEYLDRRVEDNTDNIKDNTRHIRDIETRVNHNSTAIGMLRDKK